MKGETPVNAHYRKVCSTMLDSLYRTKIKKKIPGNKGTLILSIKILHLGVLKELSQALMICLSSLVQDCGYSLRLQKLAEASESMEV